MVKQYLLEHPERVQEDTQEAIASDLGVAQNTVSRAIEECGKSIQVDKLSIEEKKQQVREYVKANPSASNREIAREVECDVTHVTVGKWRDKTPGQIVNEFEEMLAIERERAKDRKGERNDLKDEPVGNVSHKSENKERARDKAAEKVNASVSGRTLEKGLNVKKEAERGDERRDKSLRYYLDYLEYPSVEDVADELGCGTSTVDRDLSQKTISGDLGTEHDFIKVDNIWRFQHPELSTFQ